MLWTLAALYFDRGIPEEWRERCKVVLYDGPGDELRQQMKIDLQHIDERQFRAHFIDAETAILAGDHRGLDRDSIECRLCGTRLAADDAARATHLRIAHWKEWRRLFR